MLNQIPGDWNAHERLEFAKMCIRTISERVQAELKIRDKTVEEELNDELNDAINVLEKDDFRNSNDRERIIQIIEDLRARKEVLIEEKGRNLAAKLRTRWYNEGEKSTRYFLRLLNRSNPDKFKELRDGEGNLLTGETEIEKEIVSFYKRLYENYDKSNLTNAPDQALLDDFFQNVDKISNNDEAELVEPITIQDLTKTLRTCADSAPGPDGIPYSVLGALWTTMGPMIVDAWNHSLLTGSLSESHKVSFLRLIPKAGKDLSRLTNWRPITLSNCDHKLITKTYATRLTEKAQTVILSRQTAYIKGRLINENVRAILNTIRSANYEDDIDGLLVSLDAKKAFDSVEHSYIEECLRRFGMGKFVPIFRILYKGLRSDILINGKVVNGYRILRGVKQGDALSCIIFILCMEPLTRNIEANPNIEPIHSVTLRKNLPKAYSYADDLNGCIANSLTSLQELFNEYGRLTNLSGLELNADKTEILRLRKPTQANPEINLRINYLSKSYPIKTQLITKINGLYLQQDYKCLVDDNVDRAIKKMDGIFKSWSRRCLSTLGKINIVKTFGISQLIHVLQSIVIEPEQLSVKSLINQ